MKSKKRLLGTWGKMEMGRKGPVGWRMLLTSWSLAVRE